MSEAGQWLILFDSRGSIYYSYSYIIEHVNNANKIMYTTNTVLISFLNGKEVS